MTIVNPLSLFRRKLSFRFDNYAWIVMCEVNGIDLHQIGEIDEHKLMITLLYGAYVSDCRYNAKKERYDLKYIYEVFKKLTNEQTAMLQKAILESRLLGKTMTEWAEEGEKKK